ncbi:PTS system IIA component [Enterococcus faecalis EnGen0340]|uniref:PTS sugar transporter subunit IIA n=1 Tax=Enterococcus faecalis TaxID=1351 RepID=UPI00032DD5BA|nr:PTS sugar transporter subunit IIA [Enterococcus faecalis]EOJ99298.1 PTS system IIA component [Enterococcus faecalis EnGen0340]
MVIKTSIFSLDTTYISNKKTQEEVFEEVYLDLLKKKLVTPDFLTNLLEREHNYPTGLSLTLIDPELPNIAIPHTESTFVRTTRIIPIKLNHPLSFHNMIIPDETLSVSFLFMILNENGIEQTGLLATIMDFINTTDRSSLLAFFQCEDKEEVYRFLQKNFKGEI